MARIPSACPVADGSHSAKFSSVSIFRKRECFSKYLSSFQIAETLLRLCSSVSAAFIFPACPDRSASFPRIPLILLVISWNLLVILCPNDTFSESVSSIFFRTIDVCSFVSVPSFESFFSLASAASFTLTSRRCIFESDGSMFSTSAFVSCTAVSVLSASGSSSSSSSFSPRAIRFPKSFSV